MKLCNFQLATPVDAVPDGEDWIFEIKYDGYRIQAYLRNGEVSLYTRNGKEYTARFPTLVARLARLPVENAVIDGEVAVVGESGITDFQQLQNVMEKGTDKGICFYAFDLLKLNGKDIRNSPLHVRKSLLRKLLSKQRSASLMYSSHVNSGGDALLIQACRKGLEGLICKNRSSLYHGKRTRDWLKVKCHKRQELVVGGFTKSTNSTFGFGALLLGYYDSFGKLYYAGKVGTGFTQSLRGSIKQKLSALQTDSSPFDNGISAAEKRGVTWLAPTLVAEIEFTEWTDDNRCRHPSFKGFRSDKEAKMVRKEATLHLSKRSKNKQEKHSSEVGGVSISHSDRPIAKGTKITKETYAKFFYEFQDSILPYYLNKILVLVRCPASRSEKCFYQKHATGSVPNTVSRVSIEESSGSAEYLTPRSIEDLIELIQLNTIEFHSWSSRAKNVERPTSLIFDLDPSPEISWRKVAQAAQDLRNFLKSYGLESFAKLTGGKGIHVVVPIVPRYEWEELKRIAKWTATLFSDDNPGRFVITMSKQKRRGKIFIDYLRNDRGATSILPYSLRAKRGNAMAVPIGWDELGLPSSHYTLDKVQNRLRDGFKDPWSTYHEKSYSLTKLKKGLRRTGRLD